MELESLPSNAEKLLIQARQFIAGTIEESGGCDHGVGICACYDKGLLYRIDRELFGRYGIELIDKFFFAEPKHTYEDREPGLKWARDAEKIVRSMAAEKLQGWIEDYD